MHHVSKFSWKSMHHVSKFSWKIFSFLLIQFKQSKVSVVVNGNPEIDTSPLISIHISHALIPVNFVHTNNPLKIIGSGVHSSKTKNYRLLQSYIVHKKWVASSIKAFILHPSRTIDSTQRCLQSVQQRSWEGKLNTQGKSSKAPKQWQNLNLRIIWLLIKVTSFKTD